MALNLPVQSLEYDGLRQQLIDFLKGDQTYKDFNFEASGISTQMNILAYNTHMLGFYVKMLLDEAFVDSAHSRAAMLSHAKKTGYLPRGRRSARAELNLKIRVPQADAPANDYILVPRGASFSAANATQDTRSFQLIDDVLAKDKVVDGGDFIYSTGGTIVYEGLAQSWRFPVDSSVINQRFVVKDANLDVDTIRLVVRESEGSSSFTEYTPARFANDIDKAATVFYTTTNEEGFYQFFFGNDIFGAQPVNGNVIEVSYVASNGLTGNGAKTFQFNSPGPDVSIDYHVGNFGGFEVVTVSPSSGGMEPETVDSMRFTIPNHFRRQNRLLTASDFRSVILEEFRNVDSINVWGGEQHWQRDYGKVYCSIKPRNALYLTSAAKAEIRDRILDSYGAVGADIVFVDPQYINVDVAFVAKVDRKKTNKSLGDIQGDMVSRATAYNSDTLNTFGADLNDIDLLNAVKAKDAYITSVYTNKVMRKTTAVMYRSTGTTTVTFSNSLVKGNVRSSGFAYAGKTVFFQDNSADGGVYLYDAITYTKVLEASQGSVNYDTGVIEFLFPEFATVPGYSGQTGMVEFNAVPATPDVRTELNNIVRINSVTVNFR